MTAVSGTLSDGASALRETRMLANMPAASRPSGLSSKAWTCTVRDLPISGSMALMRAGKLRPG